MTHRDLLCMALLPDLSDVALTQREKARYVTLGIVLLSMLGVYAAVVVTRRR